MYLVVKYIYKIYLVLLLKYNKYIQCLTLSTRYISVCSVIENIAYTLRLIIFFFTFEDFFLISLTSVNPILSYLQQLHSITEQYCYIHFLNSYLFASVPTAVVLRQTTLDRVRGSTDQGGQGISSPLWSNLRSTVVLRTNS